MCKLQPALPPAHQLSGRAPAQLVIIMLLPNPLPWMSARRTQLYACAFTCVRELASWKSTLKALMACCRICGHIEQTLAAAAAAADSRSIRLCETTSALSACLSGSKYS
jgi:hypothetical protein